MAYDVNSIIRIHEIADIISNKIIQIANVNNMHSPFDNISNGAVVEKFPMSKRDIVSLSKNNVYNLIVQILIRDKINIDNLIELSKALYKILWRIGNFRYQRKKTTDGSNKIVEVDETIRVLFNDDGTENKISDEKINNMFAGIDNERGVPSILSYRNQIIGHHRNIETVLTDVLNMSLLHPNHRLQHKENVYEYCHVNASLWDVGPGDINADDLGEYNSKKVRDHS